MSQLSTGHQMTQELTTAVLLNVYNNFFKQYFDAISHKNETRDKQFLFEFIKGIIV